MSDLRRVLAEMSMTVWGLSAFSTALEAGLWDQLLDPVSPEVLARRTGVPVQLVNALLEVLLALGLAHRDGERFALEPELAAAIGGPGREAIISDLRSTHMQSYQMIEQAKIGALSMGWTYLDPAILQAQGTRSVGVVDAWVKSVIPSLEGLESRLGQPGAVFLDVGTGVGSIAIAMCRYFPHLRAVGIDPFETALGEGRKNVGRVGLSERVDLRRIAVQDLDEQEVYDFAQIPVMFLATDVLAKGLAAVREALQPGAWVMLQVLAAPGDDLAPAVLRLLSVLWGGEPSPPGRVVEMLKEAGYVETAILPPVPGPPTRYVVGRKPVDPTETAPADQWPTNPGTTLAN